MNRIDLAGRIAVVTGGAQGIGLAIAERMLDSGAKVVLWDIDAARLEIARNTLASRGTVETKEVELTDEHSVGAATSAAVDTHGRIDILVNNAGITGGNAPTWELDPTVWRRVIEVNLVAPYLTSRAVVPHMVQRGFGRIINIASIAGMHASVQGPHYAPYAATKAGLIGLTRELAVSWARKGIRVNAIAPGFFHSRLADGAIAMNEASIKASSPIPRVGGAGELKGVAVFLAADASNYITGQTIVVDGGRTIA
jgi:2-dehydro-3-deoxy-L-rhamnonate dehydrogenase (NAD+)